MTSPTLRMVLISFVLKMRIRNSFFLFNTVCIFHFFRGRVGGNFSIHYQSFLPQNAHFTWVFLSVSQQLTWCGVSSRSSQIIHTLAKAYGSRHAQWWEYLLPTSMAWIQFRPGAICGLSLLFVLALLRGFFSRSSCFPPSTKTNTSNSTLIRVENLHENQLRLMWLPL